MFPKDVKTLMEKILGQLGGTGLEEHIVSPIIGEKIMGKILEQLAQGDNENNKDDAGQKKKTSLTPARALVLLGILGGVLEVNSVLLDKEQAVQILLVGSLKRKTDLDKKLDKIGSMSFDQVMRAIIERYT